jgi:hypothetical protein
MHSVRPPSPGAAPQILQRIRFGEYLCEQSVIDEAQLLEALADHWSNGGNIGAAIVRAGFLSVAEVEHHALQFHTLETIEI